MKNGIGVFVLAAMLASSSSAQSSDEVYLSVRHIWRISVQRVKDANRRYHRCASEFKGNCEFRAATDLFD